MTIDSQTLKNPKTWAVVIPAILFITNIYCLTTMLKAKNEAKSDIDTMKTVVEGASQIENILEKISKNNPSALAKQVPFDSIASARVCADQSDISESRLTRGESSRPRDMKDGSKLYRETYNIRNISLIQLAKFVDYAETNFKSISCSQLAVFDSRNTNTNNWDATINLQYLIKPND